MIAAALRERVIYLRRLKVDVLPDLPMKQFRRVHVPMQPRQAALYRQVRDELALEVDSVDDRALRRQYAHFFARRSALLQVCSHPASVDPSYDEVPAKLLALDTLLGDLIGGRGEKVVVWTFFRFTLEQIVARYARYSPVRVDGSVTDVVARAAAVEAFQSDPKVKLFVGNPAAAGAGITLTAACHAVYESFSNQGAHYLQSLDRLHRRGQTREVTNHVLLCDGTIDVADYEKLLHKESRARDLLGDAQPAVMTRDEFLADLREPEGER